MEKIPLVKEKEKSIISGFLLDFLQVSFRCGVSHQCLMGCVIAGNTHSEFVTVCLKHFHRLLITVVPERVK